MNALTDVDPEYKGTERGRHLSHVVVIQGAQIKPTLHQERLEDVAVLQPPFRQQLTSNEGEQ